MARHSQRATRTAMTCVPCKNGDCGNCVDILRSVYTDKPICECTRQGHGGEPVDQQIRDPETGAVHAPGLVIEEDGEVHARS